MKRHVGLVLLAGIVLVGPVWAQDESVAGRGVPPNKSVELQKIELSHKQLELQAHADEVAFQQKQREIQLEKQRLEIAKQRAAIQSPPGAPPPAGQQPPTCMQPPPGPFGGHGCPMGRCARGFGFIMAFCFVLHILLTVWVYQDIRKRNTGSGLWIAITLLTGFVGAALYALVRIGDKPIA